MWTGPVDLWVAGLYSKIILDHLSTLDAFGEGVGLVVFSCEEGYKF